jgi:hypothetical protein
MIAMTRRFSTAVLLVSILTTFSYAQNIGRKLLDIDSLMQGHYKIKDVTNYSAKDINGNSVVRRLSYFPDTLCGIEGLRVFIFDTKSRCTSEAFIRRRIDSGYDDVEFALDVQIGSYSFTSNTAEYEKVKSHLSTIYGPPKTEKKSEEIHRVAWQKKGLKEVWLKLTEGQLFFYSSK